jgi:hypothetical protein
MADVVGAKWRSAHGQLQWHCVARERRRQARLCLGVELIREMGKVQGGAHGWRLHVLCVAELDDTLPPYGCYLG